MRTFKKPNANWILCPSKSVPGKFYYFNVATGEAVWGLDDTDGNTLQRDNNIYKEVDQSHIYPETFNEMQRRNNHTNIYTNTNNINRQNYNNSCPNFGQAIFPQYISHTPSLMPGVVWTPIQMPLFMSNREEKTMLDRDTQTSDIGDIMIQTCGVPLSKRFSMLRCNNDLEDSSKKIEHTSPIGSGHWWNKLNNKPKDKQQCKRKLELFSVIKEPKLNFLTSVNKPEEHIEEMVNKKKDMLENLEKTDLRHLLILKRQKSIGVDVIGNDKKEENIPVQNVSIKKKVTFNLNSRDDVHDTSLDNHSVSKSFHSLQTQNLEDKWYIITDRDVLLEEFNFITDYVNADDLCNLLVLKSVLNNIETSGFGDSGLPQVLAARHLYRKIVNYCKVEIIDMEEDMSLNDQIINCCLQVIKDDNHIVLITKNTKLLERAKLFEIHAFYLDDIKKYISKDLFETKTVKNVDKNKNVILQNIKTNDNNQFVFNKNGNFGNNLNNKNEFCKETGNLNDTKDGEVQPKIYIEVLNINRNIEKLNLNNSKDPRVVSCKFIDSKTDYKTNNEKSSIYKEILSNCDKDLNKLEIFDANKAEYQNATDYYKETNVRERHKQNGDSFFENFVTTDDINKNRDTDIQKNENSEKSFYIKDKNVENNIVRGINEYSCCFVQIMEELINVVLEKNTFAKRFLPCFVHEGLECLKEFCLDVNIKNIIEKLLFIWKKEEKNKTDVTPNDFICSLEYGRLLIDHLKHSIPNAIEDIENLYKQLLENINNPILEDIGFIQTPIRRCIDDIPRSNFVKDESEIVNYLKKHYPEWKDYDIPEHKSYLKKNHTDHNIQVLRTSGKYLNSFKINNKKRITFMNSNENENKEGKVETKIIKNVELIEEFEKDTKIDNVMIKTSDIINNDSSINDVKSIINNDNGINNVKSMIDNDNDFNDANNDTTDSGFEAESHTCSFLRDFFIYLSSTFKIIFNFVEKCHNEFRNGDIEERDKKCIYERATRTYGEMNDIIEKLKSIVERESKENSKLKTLLIKTGQDVSEDKRMMRYRQTVMKCLEQAQVLNSCLKLILNMNKDNVNDNISINSYDIGYLNIFE